VPLYFDPLSIEAMISALNLAASLPDSERQERIQKGINRSLLFSWDSSRMHFIDAIKSLC
jgi:hypothetical protein